MVTKTRENIKVVELLERMRRCRPRTKKELANYVQTFLGVKIPGKRICAGHDSPLDYLAWSVLGRKNDDRTRMTRKRQINTDKTHTLKNNLPLAERFHKEPPDFTSGANKKSLLTQGAGQDCVVWANRGGGKTQLGAVASLLECVFLAGCQVRILGGSEEQAQLMYRYLRESLEKGYGQFVKGQVTNRGCSFKGGAQVQVLTQSDRSVRGQHVQRLRCDEVELFEKEIWGAAQFVTQSKKGIAGRLEALSTMHRPYGLMSELVKSAEQNGVKLFRWCLWEVIEKCRDRSCSQCGLWEDCQGRAKEAEGYFAIEDAIAQKRRSSRQAWRAEMLCKEPYREDLVFSEFEVRRHVREVGYNGNLPLYRSIDFGFSNPLACLLIQVDEKEERVFILDEHLKSRTTLAEQVRLIKERWPWKAAATYCDPAGRQRNEITGTNLTAEMAALGMPVQWRRSRILDGVEMIRRFLDPAEGESKLIIAPKCENLIRALQSLRYQRRSDGQLSELPEKDGVNDHIIDALRYFFVNRFARSWPTQEKRY